MKKFKVVFMLVGLLGFALYQTDLAYAVDHPPLPDCGIEGLPPCPTPTATPIATPAATPTPTPTPDKPDDKPKDDPKDTNDHTDQNEGKNGSVGGNSLLEGSGSCQLSQMMSSPTSFSGMLLALGIFMLPALKTRLKKR